MRVAVCLSGQARAIEANLHTIIENLIEPCGADVFCHFWDSGLGGRSRAEEAVARLRPKYFQIDEQIDFGRYPGKGNIPRTRSMFYSLKQANSLKKLHERREGFVYDFVIRTRTDLVIQKPFKPEEHDPEFMYARSKALGKVCDAEKIENGEFIWCYREPPGALDGVGRFKFEDDMFLL